MATAVTMFREFSHRKLVWSLSKGELLIVR
jgi:hypothetical protein